MFYDLKTLRTLEIEGTLHNRTRGIYEKLRCNTIFNGKRLNAFYLRLGRWYEYLFSPLLFNIIACVVR